MPVDSPFLTQRSVIDVNSGAVLSIVKNCPVLVLQFPAESLTAIFLLVTSPDPAVIVILLAASTAQVIPAGLEPPT